MAIIPETAPAPASGVPRWRRFLTPWRSPADQPAWARPALLAIAALAAVAYGWGMAGASVEPFYGAAARSMSESWHDFIFAAFDPAGTVTIDKLPGELWVQALSLRIFGFHIWALVLPQVVEGVLTVLVLYRAVRRLAGPAAGLTAAAVLAVTPVTVLLSRGNVSDSLLILLLVLAADATSAALLTGSLRQRTGQQCGGRGVSGEHEQQDQQRVRHVAAAQQHGDRRDGEHDRGGQPGRRPG